MDGLSALQSKCNSCADIKIEDEEPNSSYHTVTEHDDNFYDDDDEPTTTGNFDALSMDGDVYASLSDVELTDELSKQRQLERKSTFEKQSQFESQPREKLPYECKLCVRKYRTLQECLQHELLDHNNSKKIPQKSVRSALSQLLPALKHANQAERNRIRELLQKSKRGLELHEVFKVYCINAEKLRQIVSAVTTCLLKDLSSLQNIQVYTFGSCENGLMLWGSDIDIYATAVPPVPPCQKQQNNFMALQTLNYINNCLRKGLYFDEIICIRQARVPIVKCRHLATGIRIDINCSCPNSVFNTKFVRELMTFDVRLHTFVRFMKIWAKQMGIIGRHQMSSYCLCLLLVFYLQQPRNSKNPYIPCMQEMQFNVDEQCFEGVNYAFDLYQHMYPLPPDLSTSQLIRGFFEFYRSFDFSKHIVAPYLGEAVPIDHFRTGKYKYTDYFTQLKAIKKLSDRKESIEELNIERVMIVQDPFQLNQNVARNISLPQLDYFRKCIEYGYHISTDSNITTDRQLYETLFCDVIDNIENEAKQLQVCTGNNTSMVQPYEMAYTFSPCRAEIHALHAQQMNIIYNKLKVGTGYNIKELWARHYIEAIYIILTHVYALDVKLLTDNDNPYDEQFLLRDIAYEDLIDPEYSRQCITDVLKQFEKKNEVVWVLNGIIDTWSERTFQRYNSQTFISIQCVQTKKFLNERSDKSMYSVNLLGRFTLKTIENFKMIEISLKQHQQTRQWFCKKDPMRKFFANFKCSLQNFNLKEKVQAESGRRYDETIIWRGIAATEVKT